MNELLELFSSMDNTARMVILSATLIIVFILFAKAVKFVLKLVVIAVMVLFIVYFLRMAGLF